MKNIGKLEKKRWVEEFFGNEKEKKRGKWGTSSWNVMMKEKKNNKEEEIEKRGGVFERVKKKLEEKRRR